MTELKMINMKDIEIEEVEWLWQDFIPYRKITILHGDPGEGKTTALLQIIASLTTGREILSARDDPPTRNPVNVIYQTAEDGLGDTIKPRLVAAGADCSKVLVIDDSEKALTMSDDRLEEAIIATGAKLVVLDPVQAYLGAAVDMHRANEVRPIMNRIGVLAERYGCAFVLVGHMNKSSVLKANYRGLGSIDFSAAARSVILCARVKDDPDVRVLVPQKASLAYEPTAIAFRLSKDYGFEWIGEYDITPDELLSGSSRGKKSREATEFLKKKLADGMKASKELYDEAEAEGIRNKTLRNAMKELHTEAIKDGDRWYTALPDDGE